MKYQGGGGDDDRWGNQGSQKGASVVLIHQTLYFLFLVLIIFLQVRVGQKSNSEFSVHLTTDHIAPFTWLDATGLRGRFSDNGFIMVQSKMIVMFYAWESGITSDVLQKAITVRSLMNIYE